MTLPEATARARAALRSAGGCRLISANAAQATDKWQMSIDGTDGRTSERNRSCIPYYAYSVSNGI